MRIAINTRFLLPHKMEGFGRFTFEVTKRLVAQHPEHDFYFFFDRAFDYKFVFGKNVIPIVLNPQARDPILFKLWFNWSVTKALEKYRSASFGTCINNPEPNYKQALAMIKLEQFTKAKEKLNDVIERHSLTKHHKLAKRQLLLIAKLEKKIYLENESRLFTDRKIFTPDF